MRLPLAAPVLLLFTMSLSAQNLCLNKIVGNEVVATAQQRYNAGQIAEPPLTDASDGFAWPDTPLGAIKMGNGYAFFGSDGGQHARQLWQGKVYGNNKYGSITRTLGSLQNPLGSAPPVDVSINANPDPAVNPFYASYDYMGGGPVYQVPNGFPGAGNLLMVYHAEIPTVTTQSFYSVLALASSSDDGMSWTDLGEIVRVNQGYRSDMDGFDIGDSTLVMSPDQKYFYIYFPDWLANGTTHWGATVTFASVARASVDAVLAAAFGDHPHAATFQKYYAGWRLDQGLGGYSGSLSTTITYGGNLHVAYNASLKIYQLLLNAGVVVYYSESADGMTWSPLTVFYDFRNQQDMPTVYVAFVGTGPDPHILNQQFYVFYTSYPTTGAGWAGATVNRFTVSCQ